MVDIVERCGLPPKLRFLDVSNILDHVTTIHTLRSMRVERYNLHTYVGLSCDHEDNVQRDVSKFDQCSVNMQRVLTFFGQRGFSALLLRPNTGTILSVVSFGIFWITGVPSSHPSG